MGGGSDDEDGEARGGIASVGEDGPPKVAASLRYAL